MAGLRAFQALPNGVNSECGCDRVKARIDQCIATNCLRVEPQRIESPNCRVGPGILQGKIERDKARVSSVQQADWNAVMLHDEVRGARPSGRAPIRVLSASKL